MTLLEKDLEKIIMESSPVELEKRGLRFYHQKKKNQFRIGNYGVADIVGYDIYDVPCGTGMERIISVYELKKDVLSVSAFLQAVKYVRGLQMMIQHMGKSHLDFHFQLILIGKKPKHFSNDWIYLPDVFCSEECMVRIYSYDYDIKGVSFKEEEGYKLVEEGWV